MTGGHGSKVCQFGTTHSRCRCMDKSVISIPCPTPEKCMARAEAKADNLYEPKHRRDA